MKVTKLYTTIDAHTGGEPLRIITGGLPPLKGETMLERRAYFGEHLDHIRRVLMHEPRGHHGMYGCVITPPVSPDADFGVLFMHNEGLSTMCGHGIIAVVKAALETGYLPRKGQGEQERVVIDSPAGKIIAHARMAGDEVKAVSFLNVPSFLFASDVELTVDGVALSVDIAFGGAFYAIAEARDLGLRVEIAQLPALQRWGAAIKREIESRMEVRHPLEPELHGIYGVIFSDTPQKASSHLRNVTIFADRQIDRSPCGTGTAARVAALYRRGLLDVGEPFVHEGITGSQFVGRVTGTTRVGAYDAVIPSIEGRAFLTGLHQFVVDPTDPLADGFLLG
ncbi:proline racemase family protein [Brevibacillus sp. SYP-B805]|uniref:proline racemase family protein n=1 Tax=Brevibacillus sp. SYP-B805 TaxID=1578199 RepID=UPI0013EB4E7A|nr:proline racemase family protein [Brevibacillus sp. SYP-B805]NGQ97437.1 proline racemase family protein [Brevibacillus sp. SYP-B805]